MQFLELFEQDHRRFNEFVSKHKSGSFLQAFEWGELQHEYSNKNIKRFAVTEGENIILAAQVIITPLFGSKYYAYIPYGPVVSDENDVTALQYFLKQIKEQFKSAVCIRIEPKFTPPAMVKLGKKSVNIQPSKTCVVPLDNTETELLAAMHSKTRYNIKVAQKYEIEIQTETVIPNGHDRYYQEAIDLILDTAKRQGYVTHPRAYYEKIVNFFSDHKRKSDVRVTIYKAIYKRSLVATGIMVDFGKTRTYLFGGSSIEFRNIMAPHLLHYQAMIDSKNDGMTEYDLDGIETSTGKEAGFARFKLGFGGHIVSYAGAHDLILRPFNYRLYTILRWLNRLRKKLRY